MYSLEIKSATTTTTTTTTNTTTKNISLTSQITFLGNKTQIKMRKKKTL